MTAKKKPAKPRARKLVPPWLSVAVDRVAAGEPVEDVLNDYGWHYDAPPGICAAVQEKRQASAVTAQPPRRKKARGK